jgi:hypothetical protein
MNQETRSKLEAEIALTRHEQVDLELGLESEAQLQARAWAGAMADDSPSLAWRSELNERLIALQSRSARKRRSPLIWISASSLGLVGAAAIAVALLRPTEVPVNPAADNSIEATLVATHIDSISALDSGVLVAPRPTTETGVSRGPSWDEVDVEAL